MPYITKDRRAAIDQQCDRPATAGELTYVLTCVVLDALPVSPRFSDYAEAIAALECAKLELYRRSVAPHEDEAASLNGDLHYPRPA